MPGMEPRARPRASGPFFSQNETNSLENILYAYGDESPSLPETIRVFDEILVDFVIELCYEAEGRAAHASRGKVTQDDFKFSVRRNPKILGRVQELFALSKIFDHAKKGFDVSEAKVRKGAAAGLDVDDDENRKKKKPSKKGKNKKRKGDTGDALEYEDDDEDNDEDDAEAEIDPDNIEDDVASLRSAKSTKSARSRKSVGSKRNASTATLS